MSKISPQSSLGIYIKGTYTLNSCLFENPLSLYTAISYIFRFAVNLRPGMDLWRVIVFAIVKQCLDLDYDALLYRANKIFCCGSCWGMASLGLMRRSTAGSAWWTPCSFIDANHC